MDKLEYYRELEREQQGLERSIKRRTGRIEELVQDIASLKEVASSLDISSVKGENHFYDLCFYVFLFLLDSTHI